MNQNLNIFKFGTFIIYLNNNKFLQIFELYCLYRTGIGILTYLYNKVFARNILILTNWIWSINIHLFWAGMLNNDLYDKAFPERMLGCKWIGIRMIYLLPIGLQNSFSWSCFILYETSQPMFQFNWHCFASIIWSAVVEIQNMAKHKDFPVGTFWS